MHPQLTQNSNLHCTWLANNAWYFFPLFLICGFLFFLSQNWSCCPLLIDHKLWKLDEHQNERLSDGGSPRGTSSDADRIHVGQTRDMSRGLLQWRTLCVSGMPPTPWADGRIVYLKVFNRSAMLHSIQIPKFIDHWVPDDLADLRQYWRVSWKECSTVVYQNKD